MRPTRRSPLKLSLLSCAIASAVAGFSTSALAVDLCAGESAVTVSSANPGDSCNLNQANATLTVTSAGSIGLGVDVNANGVTITNNGDIGASQTALHYLGSHGISTLTNNGDITVNGSTTAYGLYSNGTVDLDGTLRNSGGITLSAEASTASILAAGIWIADDVAGLLDNQGRISVDALGKVAEVYGIDVEHEISGNILNSGNISVAATASSSDAYAYGIATNGLTGSGSIGNTGTISATADGVSRASVVGIDAGTLGGTSSVSNSGSITATAVATSDTARAWGIKTGQLADSASITNSGTLTVSGTGAGNSDQAFGIQTTSLAGSARLVNSGDIDVGSSSANFGYAVGIRVNSGMAGTSRLENSGDIIADASGTSANASGLWVSGVLEDGVAIVNSGRVIVTAVASSQGAYGWGMSADNLQGEFINDDLMQISADGRTEVTAAGMWMATGNGGVLSNDGVISATASGGTDVIAYGIYTEGNTLGTTVSNSGSILSRATAGDDSSSAAAAFGIYSHTVDATSSIRNSGDIAVAAVGGDAQAYGIYVRDTLDGTVTNTDTIVAAASGATASALGVYAGGGSGSVVNSGTIIGGVSLGGTVDLDNSSHILTTAGNPSHVGGDYTQGTDGLLTLQVQSAGRYAAFDVGGEADFTASDSINIMVTPDVTLVDGSTLANVVSAGTLTTDLDGLTVTDSSLFWVFTGVMDGDTLDLDVDFGGAAAGLAGSGQAFTASQLAFADAVLLAGSGGTYSELSAALNGATDAFAAADALESVGPALPGAAAAALRSAGAGASHAISARQGETRGAASGDAFSQNALWLKPFVGQAEQDSVDGVDGYDVDSNGFVIGLDGDVSDRWRLGVAVASGQGEVGGAKASLDVTSTQLTVYGSYAMSDSATLDLNIDHLSSSVDSTRLVALANTPARASYDASQFAAGATVSNRVAMGERSVFIPSLQARYQRVSLDGYSETGAGVYNLTVESGSEGSLLWAAEGAFEIGMGKGTLLASAGLGYDTLDAASLTATLNGGTGPTFISNGIKPDSTVVTGGLGYRHVTAKALEISVAYDMESRGDFVANTLSLKFKLPL